MRGKGGRENAYEVACWITPAYAGKRTAAVGIECGDLDHPCICGEKCQGQSICVVKIGSPLHMRGKVRYAIGKIKEYRITPAYAGKRLGFFTFANSLQDHPCICGEKNELALLNTVWVGSPLHMRGKGKQLPPAIESSRITPAYAGKR